jgi:hypothetical protein
VAGQKGRLRRWNFGSQAKRIPSPALFALACLPCPGFDDSHPHPHPEYLTLFPDSDPSYITVYLRYTWHSSVHQLLRSSPRRAHTVLYYNLRLVQCERLSDKARPCTLIFPRRHIISHLLYRVTLFSNPPIAFILDPRRSALRWLVWTRTVCKQILRTGALERYKCRLSRRLVQLRVKSTQAEFGAIGGIGIELTHHVTALGHHSPRLPDPADRQISLPFLPTTVED